MDKTSNKTQRDLHCASEVVSLALLVDDVLVDLPRRYVVVPLECHIHEPQIFGCSEIISLMLTLRRVTATTDNCIKYSPFVVAQVQINLAAIVEDVDLSVLVGGEGAGVDVYVRVDLDAETQNERSF